MRLLTKYFDYLDRKGNYFNITLGLICTAVLGLFDHALGTITDTDFTLAFFYLLPISFVSWFAGRTAGVTIALVGAGTRIFNYPFMKAEMLPLVWKSGTVFAFFSVIAVLIAKVRELLKHEREMARTDHLTKAVNARAFIEILDNEALRQRRHNIPFSLAYIDIDDFKKINDEFGHKIGDSVLQSFVQTASDSLRKTDVVARLGGDEFALLLTNTDEESALAVMKKLLECLHMNCTLPHKRVTFSIGLLVCAGSSASAEELLTLADNLMYEAKKGGKNNIRHAVYSGKTLADIY